MIFRFWLFANEVTHAIFTEKYHKMSKVKPVMLKMHRDFITAALDSNCNTR